jgi:hypothetical protein
LGHSTVQVLFLLFLLLVILPVTSNIKTEQAQSPEKFELIATIEPPSNIAAGSTIKELNFTTSYELSRYFMPSETEKYNLHQGVLSWLIQGQPFQNVSIHDNLGNSFSPIINETTIMSPDIENIVVQAFFNYKITLYLETIGDVGFDSSMESYGYYVGLINPSLPTTVVVRLPESYSVIQYSVGCTTATEQGYMLLQWTSTEGESLDCLVRFMPFSIEPTIRSLKLTMDCPSYWPPSSSMKLTFEETFDLPSVVMIWNLSLIIELPVSFPSRINASSIQVESVFDGQGQCERLTSRPVSATQNSQIGHFFVDYKDSVVLVYPRPSYQDRFEQFDVKVTFTVPNNSPSNDYDPKIPFWQPYRNRMVQAFNLTVQTDSPIKWHLNLTDSFQVEFILPSGTEPFSVGGDQPAFGSTEDNRRTATFVYNSPTSLPANKWIVMFDIISFKDFFTYLVINIVGLSVAVVVLAIVTKIYKFKTKMAWLETVPIFALLSSTGENVREFFVLEWSDWFVETCIVIELLLSLVMIVFVKNLYQKRKPNKFTVPVNRKN